MRKILILGAGRSASSLIHYLVRHAAGQDWHLTVGDLNVEHAQQLLHGGKDVAEAVALDASDAEARARAIEAHDLVISMLPASMHMDVLKDCLRLKKHVITPSYVPDELWAMDTEFKAAGLVVLNEMGLDPGIDHMSAMRILDRIRREGGRMEVFESHCGGLVAPESDDNPWGYKFSWNPRNVVLAGQGGAARYIRDGVTKYIPYHRLFGDAQRIEVRSVGSFDAYANRDSLKYRAHYGLEGIPTLLRGTLRKGGFCDAWDVLVRLGCTDDGYTMELPPDATWKDYLLAFLPHGDDEPREQLKTMDFTWKHAPGILDKLEWLGLFSDGSIGVSSLSPAATLQHLLEQKWKLGPADKDMVVMWHRFRWTQDDRTRELHASMVVIGEDQVHTAMARTVGLPIAIATKLLLNGGITERGVLLPLNPGIYDPVLDELEEHGIRFAEQEVEG